MNEKKLTKTTEFEGYMSGDGECFCLSKKPYKDFIDYSNMSESEISQAMKEEYENILYPSAFFPDECAPIMSDKREKFKFKITVEAIPS